MKSTSPKRNILAWQIAALLSVALITLIGVQLEQKPESKIVFLIVFGVGALFLFQRKIFDARVIFALCGVGLGLVFGTLGPALEDAWEWRYPCIAIAVAYGFAALMKSEGFLDDLASILAKFGVGSRSSPLALLLATSFIAFAVNAIIMSAGSSCAVVAPLFVPLLISRFPAPVAAAAIVIGAWGGFINPFDVGGLTITKAFVSNNLAMYSIPVWHIGPAILALVAANLTFALMNRKESLRGQSAESVGNSGEVLPKGTGRRRGIIAILPLLLLIPLPFIARSLHSDLEDWNLTDQDLSSICLSICLVVASIAASVVVVRDSGQGWKKVLPIAKVFSGGMWKGFAEVVVLIVAAKLFISPYKDLIKQQGGNVLALVSVPAAFGASALIGSGDAVVSSLIPTVVSLIGQRSPVPPVAVPSMFASMLWLATEMGRNVSPISAAAITCAREASKEKEIDSAAVARHVLIPLIVGLVIGCSALYVVFQVFE